MPTPAFLALAEPGGIAPAQKGGDMNEHKLSGVEAVLLLAFCALVLWACWAN